MVGRKSVASIFDSPLLTEEVISVGAKMAPIQTTFAQATAVKQQSSHEYLAEFPDDWCIGTGEGLDQSYMDARN
jgi:hypothetical protein